MAPFKLYYTPTSCGAANYIVASLAGVEFDAEQVNLRSKRTASGADLRKTNVKGNLPTLVLADGTVLNENIATLSYLADQGVGLAPPPGPGRYAYLNALGFVNSELHPAFGHLFSTTLDDANRKAANKVALEKARYFTDEILAGGDYVLGSAKAGAVDIYAYVVLSWAKFLDVDLSKNADAVNFIQRIAALPQVAAAHAKMEAAVTS